MHVKEIEWTNVIIERNAAVQASMKEFLFLHILWYHKLFLLIKYSF